jgi:O-antigen ligase
MLLLFYLAWRWSLRHAHGALKRRTIILVVALSAIAVVLLSGSVALLQSPSQRVIQAIEGHAVTVDYRLFLWKTGLKAFVDSPLLGIGLGQIRSWDEILPYWRFDPMATATKGLGAHNDFITYIAETGLIGMGCILALFWLTFRMGGAEFHRARTLESARAALMLWLPVCAILMRFFFGTHMFYSISGILTAFYFALLIKHSESGRNPLSYTTR